MESWYHCLSVREENNGIAEGSLIKNAMHAARLYKALRISSTCPFSVGM